MSNVNIIIENSGLLEKFGCTVDDILHSYRLYRDGFLFPEKWPTTPGLNFISLLQEMTGSLEDINFLFEKHKRKN